MDQKRHDADNETTLDLPQKRTSKNVSKNSTTTPIRIKTSTQKELKKVLQKANKKSFGKKIKPDDVLELLIGLIEEKHIKKLQENSLSNADRLEMSYKEYCKKNGQITKDEYLGRLLKPTTEALANTPV